MKIPQTPANENERLDALRCYNILDTMPEKDYDAIVKMAAQITGSPLSLVSLVAEDRQWFKARVGVDIDQTSRDVSFCAHAINTPHEPMIVPDTQADKRFANNPLVRADPRIRFYMGIPLVDSNGYALGTLCVLDVKPMQPTQDQIDSLQSLADITMRLIESRKKTTDLDILKQKLEHQLSDLETFSYALAHDLKAPLNTIESIARLLLTADLDEATIKKYHEYVDLNARNMRSMINGILDFHINSQIALEEKETLPINAMVLDIVDLIKDELKPEISFNRKNIEIRANRQAIHQILSNLIMNAIKHNDKKAPRIEVNVDEQTDSYFIEVKDNGPGIPKKGFQKIFKLFGKLNTSTNIDSTGIGLSIVKSIIDKMGGVIDVDSKSGEWTSFKLTIPK